MQKLDKLNYTLAKVYRSISLLATLSKILKSIVVDRISYMVEEYRLLSTNYFKVRKRQLMEQALTLL